MVERLTRLDASFLYLEEPDTPMHVGGRAHPRGAARWCRRARRAGGGPAAAGAAVPPAGGRGARATWPIRSGSTTRTSTSPITSAATGCRARAPRRSCWTWCPGWPRDRWTAPARCGRCTWSRGCRGGRVAVVTKTHPALVDGLSAIDIGQVLLDVEPDAPAPEPADWRPQRPPNGAAAGVAGARRVRPAPVGDRRRRPRRRHRRPVDGGPAHRRGRRTAPDGPQHDAAGTRTAR